MDYRKKCNIFVLTRTYYIFWNKTYSGKRASPWRSSHKPSPGDSLLPRDRLSRGSSRNPILQVFSPLGLRKTPLVCGQHRQAGWAGRDPCPGRERTVLAAAGAPTALPMWLQSLKLLPAVAGGSNGKATNGPVSQHLMPIDRGPRGVPPRLGTSIAGAAAKAAWGGTGSAARAPAPRGKAACHCVSYQRTAAVGATSPAVPEGVKGPGSAHPQIQT